MSPDQRRLQIAARLREAREYLGISQDEVASVLGISRPAVTNIESGSRKVEAVELDELARLYGRPVSYFLEGEQQRAQQERVEFLARKLSGLSQKDLLEVERFAEFLRTSPKKKPGGRGQP